MAPPENKLEVLEVPGLAEARQRETEIRDRAFLPVELSIAGIPVEPFCLRHLLTLDYLKNGFVVPCTFERSSEKVAHALQFIGIVSTLCELSAGPFFGLRLLFRRWSSRRFIRRALTLNADRVFADIERYVDEAFYDCPKRSAGSPSVRPVTSASFMASMVDDLVGAGYTWSETQIFNLPLSRLWQYWRMSLKRINPGETLTNPSDRLADDFIAKLNEARSTAASMCRTRGNLEGSFHA